MNILANGAVTELWCLIMARKTVFAEHHDVTGKFKFEPLDIRRT